MAKTSKGSNLYISMAYRETIARFHTFAHTFAIHHGYGCVWFGLLDYFIISTVNCLLVCLLACLA